MQLRIGQLRVPQYPKIVPPEVRITTSFVGADAQTVEQSVAAPIEQQMSGVDNMNYMTSINGSDGSLRLIANFDIATEPNNVTGGLSHPGDVVCRRAFEWTVKT